jgi:hypothetical protein
VVARRLLLWTDDLGCAGLGLCPQGAGVRHQASDNKHGRPGRVSAFVGRMPVLNIECLHGRNVRLRACVCRLLFVTVASQSEGRRYS